MHVVHDRWKALRAAPPASSEAARVIMRANRGKDTTPEVAVRRELHRRGLRYRVHERPLAHLRRMADVVFRRARVAVFVDGCFWHGCPEHGSQPRANAPFWQARLGRNKERDAETTAALCAAGWTVIRIWEHESPVSAADRIERVVRKELRNR